MEGFDRVGRWNVLIGPVDERFDNWLPERFMAVDRLSD